MYPFRHSSISLAHGNYNRHTVYSLNEQTKKKHPAHAEQGVVYIQVFSYFLCPPDKDRTFHALFKRFFLL